MLVDLVYNKICTKKYDIAMVRQGGVSCGQAKQCIALCKAMVWWGAVKCSKAMVK